MAVANNADDYAEARVGIFFTANDQTSADGNLTGQCVTLFKWFAAEMASIPVPFAARGDARYVGDNLVAQGLADVVPAGQQKRGDVVIWKYGTYGHIAIMLSGGRIFQENANVAGAIRKVLADGTVVYSSTIVQMYASLGGIAPTFYRLKSYIEGAEMNKDQATYLAQRIGLLAGMAEKDITASWLDYHSNHIMADPNYAAALCLQLYQGKDWQTMAWKAGHYDDSVKTAHDTGFKEGQASGNDFVEAPKLYVPKTK